MTSDPIARLTDFLDRLDEAGCEKVVVRWVDETRPVEHDESGYTVRRVARATLTAAIDEEVERETFEEIAYEELRELLARYPFETMFRSDNVTR
ncbi:MAG: hypothetical protein ACOCV2_04885 [Persicimonas sp.]